MIDRPLPPELAERIAELDRRLDGTRHDIDVHETQVRFLKVEETQMILHRAAYLEAAEICRGAWWSPNDVSIRWAPVPGAAGYDVLAPRSEPVALERQSVDQAAPSTAQPGRKRRDIRGEVLAMLGDETWHKVNALAEFLNVREGQVEAALLYHERALRVETHEHKADLWRLKQPTQIATQPLAGVPDPKRDRVDDGAPIDGAPQAARRFVQQKPDWLVRSDPYTTEPAPYATVSLSAPARVVEQIGSTEPAPIVPLPAETIIERMRLDGGYLSREHMQKWATAGTIAFLIAKGEVVATEDGAGYRLREGEG